ncbi:isoprenyl transferase [Alkalibacillus haloalkaliphilus]|uniref:Isoprenyl transferase n=1 Tax=Alkalibacillus haloalkaliphilus TaxID=94136 RepID=A0A511W6H7_9BACI|nr:isoprenyl transferase [Alkalibacillus haloalkaliphilus]GEN44952.1 isoprenyl transferase [Alkalibacillus haloalkaliphilus]
MLFRTNSKIEQDELQSENIPKHIAIIMDGNGRWAKKRSLPRVAGHREGMKAIEKVVKRASNLGVEALTLYAFSTENWKRPKSEVEFIMKLPSQFLDTYLPGLKENNVRITTMGDFESLPEFTKSAVSKAIDETSQNNGMVLNLALNYGSRKELVDAVKEISQSVLDGELDIESIDEEKIEDHLYTNELPDPDLLVRTSGEQRLSNYLLWQLAYAEFYFTDKLWPEFNAEALDEAIMEYQHRKRRFGGL